MLALCKFHLVKVSHFARGFALWSMKKDPELESALSRNRRWVVNNQIKNVILRSSDQSVSIDYLQRKFKTLDLQGKALNWVKKYPCCFEVVQHDDEFFCRLTKPMKALVEEEESVKDRQEPVFARRLAKLLMMSKTHKLNVAKINEVKRNFGFPDDYLLRIVPKYPDTFRVVNCTGRRNSLEIELTRWDPDLAVSAVERSSAENGHEIPTFSCSLPTTWVKSWQRFRDFNDSSPYISPYSDDNVGLLMEGSMEMEKRTVALVHELLSLTLWKKASIFKLCHFKRDFRLPDRLNVLLLKHPGIFYVTNKYRIYTVLLREGYDGSKLIERDPLVVMKDKYGEIMQQGLHEYNRRHYLMNLEKKKKKDVSAAAKTTKNNKKEENEKGGILDPEERKRFYRVLFGD